MLNYTKMIFEKKIDTDPYLSSPYADKPIFA